DGRAVVLGLENPQRLPLPLQVGDELPEHPLWADGTGSGGGAATEPLMEYPTTSTWMLAVPASTDHTTCLVLAGLAFIRPHGATAAQLAAGPARALGGTPERLRDVG